MDYTVEWFDRKADKWGQRSFKTEARALAHMEALADLFKSEGDPRPNVSVTYPAS